MYHFKLNKTRYKSKVTERISDKKRFFIMNLVESDVFVYICYNDFLSSILGMSNIGHQFQSGTIVNIEINI